MTSANHPRKTTPTHIALGDGLVLRSVQSERDAERYAAFNAQQVSEIQGITCAKLLAHHPTMRWDDFFFVEDIHSGEMVSCTCLIPWQSRLGPVDLRVAMLEMVVTHPDYRHRGLVRRQIQHFHQCAAAQNFDLCMIEGIPYYYRQFGYGYATDHWAGDGLAVARVPAKEDEFSIRLRAAAPADIKTLEHLYAQNMGQLDAWTTRDPAYWHYLIEGANAPIAMIDDLHTGTVLGYVMAWRNNSGAYIAESAVASAATALELLQWCKAHIRDELVLGWPEQSVLVQVARTLGSSVRPADQWLWRVVEMPKLLMKLAPVLASRLAASPHAGLTIDLTLNLFREAYLLRFEQGALVAVDSLGFVDASMGADGGDLCMAPDAFIRLLLGYRTLDELADAWPDTGVRPARRHLWQTLWPKLRVYFWNPYMAFDAETEPLVGDIA